MNLIFIFHRRWIEFTFLDFLFEVKVILHDINRLFILIDFLPDPNIQLFQLDFDLLKLILTPQ
jgi:hypothetical protein